jgi:hypothetical protein
VGFPTRYPGRVIQGLTLDECFTHLPLSKPKLSFSVHESKPLHVQSILQLWAQSAKLLGKDVLFGSYTTLPFATCLNPETEVGVSEGGGYIKANAKMDEQKQHMQHTSIRISIAIYVIYLFKLTS